MQCHGGTTVWLQRYHLHMRGAFTSVIGLLTHHNIYRYERRGMTQPLYRAYPQSTDYIKATAMISHMGLVYSLAIRLPSPLLDLKLICLGSYYISKSAIIGILATFFALVPNMVFTASFVMRCPSHWDPITPLNLSYLTPSDTYLRTMAFDTFPSCSTAQSPNINLSSITRNVNADTNSILD